MSGLTEPLISIITPVYNGGPYLRECIESVQAQTYPNWRYTIVNNCSSDDTAAIAATYAARDPRIRISHNQSFLPLVANHSHALTLIEPQAQFVKPLMADDWLYPECLTELAACARAHPAVGLVCTRALTAQEQLLFDRLPPSTDAVTLLSGHAAGRMALLEDRYFFGSPTTMLLRADLVRARTPFYNPDNPQADEEACYDILRGCDFAFVHQTLAYVRVHARSHTSAINSLCSIPSCRTYALAAYGRDYLSEAEFSALLARRMREYYARLAQGVIEGRDARFWEFHRRLLRMIGQPLDRLRLARAVAVLVARKFASPLKLARGLAARAQARRAGDTDAGKS